MNQKKEKLDSIIKIAESRIADSNTHVGSPVKNCEQKVRESKEIEETRKSDSDIIEVEGLRVEGLRSYWVGLNDEIKRNFMKVSTRELRHFVGKHMAKRDEMLWSKLSPMQRKMENGNSGCVELVRRSSPNHEVCESHIEGEHGAEFKPSSRKDMPRRISEVWARNISAGDWKPVDSAAAVKMIKNQFTDVKAYAYKNGWCKYWRLAEDVERSKLLKDIKFLLVSFCDHKILTDSIRDRVMHIVIKQLEKLEVSISKHTLTDCRLVETPQSICFLESGELSQILDFLKNIKCKRDDGTYLVCRAVDSFCGSTRVKVKIDSTDSRFSVLLLDKRLLQGNLDRFDGEGKISFLNPNAHYAKAKPRGDDFLSWLSDYSLGDGRLRFLIPIREHNLDIWKAALRAYQFTRRTLGTKYAKKSQFLRELQNLSDNDVLKSIELLESVAQINTKILLIEKSRMDLLNNLTRLCGFDYRLYIQRPLRQFLFAGLTRQFYDR